MIESLTNVKNELKDLVKILNSKPLIGNVIGLTAYVKN